VGESVLGARKDGTRAPAKHHVDALGVGELAHARDRFEGAIRVGIENDHAGPLNGDACDEHRERDVYDVELGEPERLRDPFGFDGWVADEHRRLVGARLGVRHGSSLPKRSASRGKTIAP
jgi:hypothetical protein